MRINTDIQLIFVDLFAGAGGVTTGVESALVNGKKVATVIAAIKMRMLRIKELKLITGFPESYHLAGTQADQKKFIGNAVPTIIPQRLCEAQAERLLEKQLVA